MSPAELAAKRDQAVHDQIAALLANDLAAFLQGLPNIYGQAVADMVAAGFVAAVRALLEAQQAIVVRLAGRVCAECIGARHLWNARHAADMAAVKEQAMAMLGTADENDPRLSQADLIPLLPERLRPGQPDGVPLVFDAAYCLNGTDLCPGHHPAAPKAGGSLIVVPGMSVHLAAQLAMGNQPGMPGVPVPQG